MSAIDLRDHDVLTFDCYGTLIDWEAGLLAALRPILAQHGVGVDDEALLEAYARHEAPIEAGDYMPYRWVLGAVLSRLGSDLGFEPTADEVAVFGASVGEWPAFPDSAQALATLGERFKLAAITNCDDDLFALSAARLGVDFDWVITAERARSYKPRARGFELALEVIGLPRDRILHVAQSLFHDHVTAKRLGLSSVWIDRRHGRPGAGATPTANAAPDLVFPDMASFASAAMAA